jgi:hypothetical protein
MKNKTYYLVAIALFSTNIFAFDLGGFFSKEKKPEWIPLGYGASGSPISIDKNSIKKSPYGIAEFVVKSANREAAKKAGMSYVQTELIFSIDCKEQTIAAQWAGYRYDDNSLQTQEIRDANVYGSIRDPKRSGWAVSAYSYVCK